MAAGEVPRCDLVLKFVRVDIFPPKLQLVVILLAYFLDDLLGLLMQIVVEALPCVLHEFVHVFYEGPLFGDHDGRLLQAVVISDCAPLVVVRQVRGADALLELSGGQSVPFYFRLVGLEHEIVVVGGQTVPLCLPKVLFELAP